MGVSTGLIVGLLNRWVASRLAAALVGILAVLPSTLLVAAFKLRESSRLSALNLLVLSLLVASVVGSIYGAFLYAPPSDKSE